MCIFSLTDKLYLCGILNFVLVSFLPYQAKKNDWPVSIEIFSNRTVMSPIRRHFIFVV